MSINIFAKLQTIAPNARAVTKMQTHTSKRDSLLDARKKTVDKLHANIAYFNDQSTERPDLVYKVQLDGTYAIGIKYGNRYLSDLFGGKSFLEKIDKDQVVAVLEKCAECVADGDCDAQIDVVMQRNVDSKNSTKH